MKKIITNDYNLKEEEKTEPKNDMKNNIYHKKVEKKLYQVIIF